MKFIALTFIRCTFFPCLLLTFTGNRLWAAENDTIYLRNGQVFVGEFVKVKEGRFEFDINDGGLVKIKYDKVKSLKAVSHTYRITTTTRKIYFGQLQGDSEDGYIKVSSGDSVVFLNFRSIAEIEFFDKVSLRTINGYLSAGYSYTRSSNIGRLNLDALISLELRKWEMSLSYTSIITYSDSIWSRDREILSYNQYYFLNASYQLGALFNYQRNIELGLARRFQEGLGLRYKMINRINVKAWLVSGFMMNQEKNLEGEKFPLRVEWPINLSIDLFQFSKPELSLNIRQTVFVSLSQIGRIRQDGDIRLNWEMINDLYLTLHFYHNYDSKPVGLNSRKLDYGTVIGLKYDLGKY